MRTSETSAEVIALVEECVDIMQKYGIEPSKGELNGAWITKQLKLYDKDTLDFGKEVRQFVRQGYETLKASLPRDVCSLLKQLVDTWCIGSWDEGTRRPSRAEVNVYLALANHFETETGDFSHFSVVEQLEEVYKFMVDGGYENVPGVHAWMGGRERRKLRDKWVRKHLREHPELKALRELNEQTV